MNPGSAELNADERADQVGDDKGIRGDVVEHAVNKAESETLDKMHKEAAVHSTEATGGSKEAEGSAEGRSNGLALTGGGRGRSASGLGHAIVGKRLDGERSVSGRLLIFDDGENGEDLLKSVGALGTC